MISLCLNPLSVFSQDFLEQSDQHLCFKGVPMGIPFHEFVDSLCVKGYQIADHREMDDEGGTERKWLQGRYDGFHCLLEVKGSDSLVDSVIVWFQNINGPVNSYRILRGFYTRQFGQPVSDNFYDVRELEYASAEEQLAQDGFTTIFAFPEGTITMKLSYDKSRKDYLYALVYADHQRLEEAIESVSDNSNHIDEEW